MAAYGGYQKTSYGAQGGDDGGGFMGASQQGSQGGQGGGKAYSDESLRPVTIKQLLDMPEAYPGAEFSIDGAPITQVTLVGQVRSVNHQSTNDTYKLDDGTGVIDVKKWVDSDKVDGGGDGGGGGDAQFPPDSHVRVFGRLKSFNGKRHVGAHMLRAVPDYNEVSYHLLEAAYVHLHFTKGPAPQNGGGGGTGGGDSMFVDSYGGGGGVGGGNPGGSKLTGCSAGAQKMYGFLHNSPGGNEGLDVNVIARGTNMGMRDVLGAADELLGQGLIYTTTDDETWAILDY